jgi:hypothetical protein
MRRIAAVNTSHQRWPRRSRTASDGPDELDDEQNEGVRAIRSGPSLDLPVSCLEVSFDGRHALEAQ